MVPTGTCPPPAMLTCSVTLGRTRRTSVTGRGEVSASPSEGGTRRSLAYCLRGPVPAEEVADRGCDHRVVRLQCKVPRVKELDVGVLVIELKFIGTRREGERVGFDSNAAERRALHDSVM